MGLGPNRFRFLFTNPLVGFQRRRHSYSVIKMVNLYRKGRIAEKKIVNDLAEKGFTNIRRSAGSRGYADIYARGPSGAKFYIQAKSGGARPTREEIRGLRALAKRRHGAAMVIHKDKQRYRWMPLGNWAHKRRKTLAERLLRNY